MRVALFKILFAILILPHLLFGQSGLNGAGQHYSPTIVPTITGPDVACDGLGTYVYVTDQFMTDYAWTVTGGTITAGGTSTDYTATITWNTVGPQSVSVDYLGATSPGIKLVTVEPTLVVGIVVNPSASTVCAGSPVTFTAIVTNGGSAPVYTWFVNNVIVGTNISTFTYTPANNDAVYCQVASSITTCLAGNPAASPPVIMAVTSRFPVSVDISASANPSCFGNPVTYTAMPFNGGNSPAFQWKKGATIISGATNSTYTYVPANGDVITCLLTSNLGCTSGNPAISPALTMTVSPNQPVGVSIVPSANPVCAGSLVTFTATPVNGGNAPFYTWKVNGTSTGLNGPTMSYAPQNGDVVTCILNSNAMCQSGNPATSNAIPMTIVQHLPVSITISASANPVCNGVPVTYTAVPVNGGITPEYHWKVNGSSTGTNSPVFTYTPNPGEIITCDLTSSESCATGNPATSNPIIMTVSAGAGPTVSVTASSNPTCTGTPIQFTALPANCGTNPGYRWKVNATFVPGATNSTYTYPPANGDVVICEITSNAMCSQGTIVLSTPITMMVSSGLPVSVTIIASENPVCPGTTVVYTATHVNGGIPVYQWKVNGSNVSGATNSTFSYIPANGEVITCELISSLSCAVGSPASSNAITMNVVTSLVAGISVSASPNPACQGQLVTFTATSVNGGLNPVYHWFVGAVPVGTSSQTYSAIMTNGQVVTCELVSSYTCATNNPVTSAPVTMVVNPNLEVSVNISTTSTTTCAGSLVMYTATPANGGTNPSYQWKVNGNNAGTNSGTFFHQPVNGDVITCVLTSSIACPVTNPVTSNSITQTVLPNMTPGVSISVSANPVCTGTEVTFTATPVNGGTPPAYQWRRNGVNAGTGQVFTFTPANGDKITCVLTSSLMCLTGNQVTSNEIQMVVNSSLPAGISIATNPVTANPFCQGSTVSFTSSVSNGGNTPQYQWLVNGLPPSLGATNPTFSYAPNDSDFVMCRVISSLACATPKPATSNPVYMYQSNVLPVSALITVSANPVCPAGEATFMATAVNGGTAPLYQWTNNGTDISGATNASFIFSPISGGETIRCRVISNATCSSGNPALSNPIIMATAPSPSPAILIATLTNPFCPGTAVTFTSTTANGGIIPIYQWKVNASAIGGATNSIYSFIPANGDVVTCLMTSTSACNSGSSVESSGITMTANTPLPLQITVTASANPSCQGMAVQFTAIPVNGGATPAFQWKVNGNNAGSNSSSYTYVPANGDAITCTITSSMVCATPNPKMSDPVVMTVNPSSPVSFSIVTSADTVCLGTMVTLTASNQVNPGTSPVYNWRKNGMVIPGATNTTYSFMPQDGDVITATMTSNFYCVRGNPAVSNSVHFVVNTPQPVGLTITASDTLFCAGSSVIFTAYPVNGGTAPTYQWYINGFLQPGATGSGYIYLPANGDQVTCQLTSNRSCIINNPALSNTITLVATALPMPVGVTIVANKNNICPGTQVRYDATVTNGGSSPDFSWKVNDITVSSNPNYFNYFPANNERITCFVESNLVCANPDTVTSAPIVMNVFPAAAVAVTITASCNSCCEGTAVTYTASPVNQGTDPLYRWKVNGMNQTYPNSPIFIYTPVNGEVISCRMTSSLTGCISPGTNPANSNSITQIVVPHSPVNVSISASDNPVCQGTTVTYTATPVNGGSTPTYQWKVNGTIVSGASSATYAYIPGNNDVVTCIMTSNAACALPNTATSNSVTMTVSPLLPVNVSIVPSANPVCQGSVTFNATPFNGGGAPAYQWKVNGVTSGTNSPIFTYSPTTGDVVSCVLTSNAGCTLGNPATSNSVSLSVIPSAPVSVSVNTTTVPLPQCQGSVVSYAATPVNGGTAPVYQWMVNGFFVGANSANYAYVPNNGDVVKCMVQSNVNCPTGNPATSNSIPMNFQPVLVPEISIAASANPVCAGVAVTLSANTVNGGTNPGYQWFVGSTAVPGATNQSYGYTPTNNDVVFCVLTSDIPCPQSNQVNSNSIALSVLPPQSSSITISTPVDTVCSGTSVSFTATAINPGSSPAYQWKVNGVNAGTGNTLTFIPLDGDVVTCQLTPSVSCAINSSLLSNAITMTVRSGFPVSISISASANPSCVGQPVTYTATIVNGGVNPEYRWMVNGYNVGGNSPTYTYTPTTGQVVMCELKSGYACEPTPALSNSIPVVVSTIMQVGVSIASSLNPACSGTPVTFTATPVNGGTAPTFQWRVNGINQPSATNPTYTFAPANNDSVTCVVSSSEGCVSNNPALSDTIAMYVSSSFAAGVSIVSSDTMVCINQQVTFTATPVFGGPAPTYQWQINGVNIAGATNSTYIYSTPVPVDHDTIVCVMRSALTCAATLVPSNPIQVIVLGIPVGVSIVANPATAVCAGTIVNYTALPVNGGPGPTYRWLVNGAQVGSNSPVLSYAPINGDVVMCMLESNATCSFGHQANSQTITTQVNPTLPVSISITASSPQVCAGYAINLSSTIVNGGTSPAYQWKENGTNIPGATNANYAYAPATNGIISCVVTSDATCPTGSPATSNTLPITVNPMEPVSVSIAASAGNPVCAGIPLTYTASPVNGGTVPGYQWSLNGVNVPGATNAVYSNTPVNNDVITCVLTSNAICPTGSPANSNALTITVDQSVPVSVLIAASANPVCAGTTVIYTATPTNGGPLPAFQWQVNSVSVAGATNPTYSYVPANNDVITCVLTSNANCATGNPATSPQLTAINGAPVVSYAVCHDMVTTTNAKPFKLRGGLPNGGVYSGPGVNSATGIFDPAAAGPGVKTITYTYPATGPCTGSSVQNINIQPAVPVACGTTINDIRDNHPYPTVLIGTQCWMAINLNYGSMKNGSGPQVDNCVNEKYCLNNISANCSLYGGLYQWDELMGHDPVPGGQGLCPPGWHVPANSEWLTLFNYYGGQAMAGDSLKNPGAGGFHFIPGGVIYQNNTWSFDPPGFSATIYWTSDPAGGSQAKSHGLNSMVRSVSDYTSGRGNGFSARCLLD